MITLRRLLLSAALMALLLATQMGMAQAPDTLWTRVYGGGTTSEFRHAEPTADGGFVLAGAKSEQFWIVKVNGDGVLQWERAYGIAWACLALYACEASDGSIISIGVGCLDNMHCGTWWTRTSADGDSLDRWFLAGGVAETARRTSDRGFIIPGSIQSGGEYGWLMKTDSAGNVQWTVTYNTINEEANCVAEIMGGGYILGGKTQPGTGFLRRVSATGQSQWRRAYSGSGFTHIMGITQTADSGFAFAGFNFSNQALAYYLYLQKVTFAGDSLWSNSFGISTFEALADLFPTQDHGFVLAGYHADSARAVAARTDSMGNQLWLETFTRSGPAAFNSVLQTGEGGYLFAGKSDYNAYLVRLEPEGAGLTAPREVTLCREDNDVILRWAADSSPLYRIYSSTSPDGPFTTLEGSTSSPLFAVPIGSSDNLKFFVVVGVAPGR